MDQKLKISEVLKKYTMIIALAVIVILFTVNTGGKMLLPQNVNNLIAQNAYVFILATGMLFCILTGGNIDLSVGSVVCFVGAIGGKMMVEMGISPYLTLIAMAIMGMLVGAWQGFWIAYVRIPPFIVTLAGMLMFRGLSNVVLQGMTLAPIPDQFLVLFNTYVPDFFAVEGFNLTCFLVGVIACVVYAFIVFNGRRQKLAKGYYVEPLTGVVIKMAVICVVPVSYTHLLKLDRNVKGIICGNDDLASQAFRALSEERLAGKVCVTGQDGDLAACQRIVEETQEMTAFKSVEQEASLAAKCAVLLGLGEEIEEVQDTAYDGTYNVPYLELQPIAVTKENMDEVIIKGGFHAKEDVYLNCLLYTSRCV